MEHLIKSSKFLLPNARVEQFCQIFTPPTFCTIQYIKYQTTYDLNCHQLWLLILMCCAMGCVPNKIWIADKIIYGYCLKLWIYVFKSFYIIVVTTLIVRSQILHVFLLSFLACMRWSSLIIIVWVENWNLI